MLAEALSYVLPSLITAWIHILPKNLLSLSCLDPNFNVFTMALKIVYLLNRCQILRYTASVVKPKVTPNMVQDTLLAVQAAYHE